MTRLFSFDRSGKAPRSALILVVLLLAALAILFVVSRGSSSRDEVLGGQLFDFDDTSINGFLFSHGGGQYRFDKNETGYWTLRGGTSDFLSQGAVKAFLNDLAVSEGGRLFAGTDIEDRRYEFNSPESLRLTVFTDNGSKQKLAVGAINPISGTYYASGIGRPGCFPVTEIFRNRLAALPAALQLSTLLPFFDRTLIQRLELWYGEELHILQRYDGRWWFLLPEGGLAALGDATEAYHGVYSDRVATYDGQTWLLAQENVPYQLVYQCAELIINEIPQPRFARARLQEWELDPPRRRVKMYGAGINPDSTEAASGSLEIAFGEAQEDKRVPVLRRGNVLMTEGEALYRLDGPLEDYLDLGAISFLVAGGDSLRGSREGTVVISTIRGEAPSVRPGMQQRPAVESWSTVYPPASMRPELREIGYNGLSRNLIVNLDRLKILKVLSATDNRQVLAENERVLIEVFGPGSKVQKLEFGFLVEENLSENLIASDDGAPPVGLWRPETGQLLQVPDHVLVTMRSLFNSLDNQ